MISFPHKTIFIHIPKCAGQSIEETFLNDIGLDWCKHRHLFGCFKKPSTWSDNFPNRLAHLTAYEYFDLDFVNKEIFELIQGLINATKLLKEGGKIIVITFHSIEDKIVKFFFTNFSGNKLFSVAQGIK